MSVLNNLHNSTLDMFINSSDEAIFSEQKQDLNSDDINKTVKNIPIS